MKIHSRQAIVKIQLYDIVDAVALHLALKAYFEAVDKDITPGLKKVYLALENKLNLFTGNH
jgi:hypothetical protein